MNVEDAYKRLPVSLQNVACSIEGWRLSRRRYNEEFREIRKELDKQSSFCVNDLEQLRSARSRTHIQSALRCPFWEKQFKQYGINPSAKHIEAELKKLPILTKVEVQKQADEIDELIIAFNKDVGLS